MVQNIQNIPRSHLSTLYMRNTNDNVTSSRKIFDMFPVVCKNLVSHIHWSCRQEILNMRMRRRQLSLKKQERNTPFSWKMELFFLCHIWNFVSLCLWSPLSWWHVTLRGHGLYVVIINYYCLVKLMDENHAVSVQTYHADNSIWGWIWKLKWLQLLEWLRHITWLGLLCSMC